MAFRRLCSGNVNDKQTGTVSDPVIAPRFEDRGSAPMLRYSIREGRSYIYKGAEPRAASRTL